MKLDNIRAPQAWGLTCPSYTMTPVSRLHLPSILSKRSGISGMHKYYVVSHWAEPLPTWFGSGSTSSQFSVRFPQDTAVKGLCLTEGKMRYNQLERQRGVTERQFYCLSSIWGEVSWSKCQEQLHTSSYWPAEGRWRQSRRAARHRGHRDKPEDCSAGTEVRFT